MPKFTLGCCDCGLVHTHVITVHKILERSEKGIRVGLALNPDDYAVKLVSWRNEDDTDKSRKDKGVALHRSRTKKTASKR